MSAATCGTSQPRISLRSSGLRFLLRSLHRPMTHRLDLVAVGIAQKCAVVGSMIVAQAGWPVVGAARGDTGVPERVDLVSRLRLEAPVAAGGLVGLRAAVNGDVDAIWMVGGGTFAGGEAAGGAAGTFAVAEPAVAAADLDDFERFHDRVVETLGGGEVGNGDGDVVQHRTGPSMMTYQPSLREARDKIAQQFCAEATKQSILSSRDDGLLRCARNDGDGGYDAFFSRSSASRIFAFRATAASRFSFSSSTISSGAFATNFSFPSLASTRLMSASALAISLSSRAFSAARSITPLSGSATTSPRTSNCTAPSGGRSAKEISPSRAMRLTVSPQRCARSLVSADAP